MKCHCMFMRTRLWWRRICARGCTGVWCLRDGGRRNVRLCRLTIIIFFTADVYSSWAFQCIIHVRVDYLGRPNGNFSAAAIAVGSRIKHEHDPRVRMAHPRSGFAKGIKRALCLSLSLPLPFPLLSLRATEASLESANHPTEWLHDCLTKVRYLPRDSSKK